MMGVLAGLMLAGGTAASAEEEVDNGCTLEQGPTRAVVNVIDGETLSLDDGSEVRLIGALAPRSPYAAADKASWPPEEAARQALSDLVLGRSVELAFKGARTDRYGRLLAHVFVLRGRERAWVQGKMLSLGHARAYLLPAHVACASELLQHEAVAREARAGLWANAAYQERFAGRTRELMRYRNSFQVVSGRVETVATAGRRVFVNFGKDWRQDFTAALATDKGRADAGFKERMSALAGKRVRVRGWIERRNGPYMQLFDAAQIEILSDNEVAGRRKLRRKPTEAEASRSEAPAEDPREEGPETQQRPTQAAPGAVDL